MSNKAFGSDRMSCRDGSCEFDSRMTREAPVSLEQRIKADLWLKEYLATLLKERSDLAERLMKEEKLHVPQ